MKKNILLIIYIVVVMAICLVPFAGMSFFATTETTENKTLASFPSLVTADGVNVDFLEDLGTYFEDHFAFRQALVNADALVMGLFGESNEDTVIKGTDGWLYYSATLDDYLGQDLMSVRSTFNAAYNLSLTQAYVESTGAQFLVTVSPNKNTLYGEHMPYYDAHKVSDGSNYEQLQAQMDALDVPYVDLFFLFRAQDEVLYLQRDSHWNNKGALLAYNALMDALEIDHETYQAASVSRTKSEIGDLGSMLYPLTAEPEYNYYYQYDADYAYVTNTSSVEDAWIITHNDAQDGSLLMFRDSFGNTLLPFFANAFGDAYFSKGEPYAIGRYLAAYAPQTVIIERVERNLADFASRPAILQTLVLDGDAMEIMDEAVAESLGAVYDPEEDENADGNSYTDSDADTDEDTSIGFASVRIASVESDASYYQVKGTVPEEYCDTDTKIYVRLYTDTQSATYPAFCLTTSQTEYGYLLYLEKDAADRMAADDTLTVDVVVETDGDYVLASDGMAWSVD